MSGTAAAKSAAYGIALVTPDDVLRIVAPRMPQRNTRT
jgi:hypothetical protein